MDIEKLESVALKLKESIGEPAFEAMVDYSITAGLVSFCVGAVGLMLSVWFAKLIKDNCFPPEEDSCIEPVGVVLSILGTGVVSFISLNCFCQGFLMFMHPEYYAIMDLIN